MIIGDARQRLVCFLQFVTTFTTFYISPASYTEERRILHLCQDYYIESP